MTLAPGYAHVADEELNSYTFLVPRVGGFIENCQTIPYPEWKSNENISPCWLRSQE